MPGDRECGSQGFDIRIWGVGVALSHSFPHLTSVHIILLVSRSDKRRRLVIFLSALKVPGEGRISQRTRNGRTSIVLVWSGLLQSRIDGGKYPCANQGFHYQICVRDLLPQTGRGDPSDSVSHDEQTAISLQDRRFCARLTAVAGEDCRVTPAELQCVAQAMQGSKARTTRPTACSSSISTRSAVM